MFGFDTNWLIFYSGLGLLVLELIVGVDTGFDFLLIGLSLIVGSLVGFWLNNYLVSISVSIIISILYLIFGRRIIKDKLYISTHKTNIDALIGKEAVVTKEIGVEKAGQIKIDNEIWRAISNKKISQNKKVKVISVEGVTVKVA